ncbi:hypothetical protein [Exiguobacterium flavidum]|uniref:hypothetical protein n=1 Tax=Exiguobacterium flavidum TaxID=2184695 RepID=UPI000DF72D3E|nr:hypothetical protein [Exiguobacterium flavidum]
MRKLLLPLAILALLVPGCARGEQPVSTTTSPTVVEEPIKRAGQTQSIAAEIKIAENDRMVLTIRTSNDVRLDDQRVDIRLEVANQSIPFPFVAFKANRMGEIRTYTAETTREDALFEDDRLPVLVIDAGAGRGIEIPLEVVK